MTNKSKVRNGWDFWSQNFYNARRFFISEGNIRTKSRLKDKWYKDFVKSLSALDKIDEPTETELRLAMTDCDADFELFRTNKIGQHQLITILATTIGKKIKGGDKMKYQILEAKTEILVKTLKENGKL